MGNPKAALNVAGIVFLVIAVLHLLRFVFKWEAIIVGSPVPVWSSAVAFAVFFLLSLWMFKSNRG